MVKIIKRKRKINLMGMIVFVFAISFVFYLMSSVMLKSYNYNMAIDERSLGNDITKLANDVANLELEVKQLDNRERVLEIAKEQGLEVNQESIVSVVDENNAE